MAVTKDVYDNYFKQQMQKYYGKPSEFKENIKKTGQSVKESFIKNATAFGKGAVEAYNNPVNQATLSVLAPEIGLPVKGAMMGIAALKGKKLVKGVLPKTTQKYTSAKTDLDQIASTFNSKDFNNEVKNVLSSKPFVRNLDYGGGKGTKSAPFLEQKGVKNSIYDPFNQSKEHNEKILNEFRTNPADMVTVNNVLNVIKETPIRKEVIKNAYDLLQPNGKAFFKIYEGNRTSIGKATKEGSWQNNKPTSAYENEIAKIFGKENMKKSGQIITVTKK